MSVLNISREGDISIIEMNNGAQDNTFNLQILDEWFKALDAAQSIPGDTALLIRSNDPKTFCTGIDLAWLMAQSPATVQEFVTQLENLFLRVATLDMPTVAEINGNCYAGGAILATACDFRYMRSDRGRFCYSEVKIKKPFTPAMLEVVRLLPNERAMYELSVTADAWGGEQCMQRGIVDAALPLEELHPCALEKAMQLATKHRPTFTTIKRGIRDRVAEYASDRGLI